MVASEDQLAAISLIGRRGWRSAGGDGGRPEGVEVGRTGPCGWRDSLDIMQATVRNYDPQTRSGSVLLDSGAAMEFGTAAFDAGGLRLLRLGQRVRLDTDDAGLITRITIVTLP